MIPLNRLYLLAGFDDPLIERHAAVLQAQYEAGTVRVLAKPHPVRPERRTDYLRSLIQSAIGLIFGKDSATNFCRKQDQPCVRDPARGKSEGKTCEGAKAGMTACARLRPQLVVVICADQLFDQVFVKLGRGTLILRIAGPNLPPLDALKIAIDDFETIASSVVFAVSNRKKSQYAPLLPYKNFQLLGSHPVAADIQADPANTAAIFARYHGHLYRGDFVNPEKPGIRGAYMLDPTTAFQEDHLHRNVQTIGMDSRTDVFHLINAYHIYGVKTDPGFHFDVMNVGGGAIGHILTDVLTGRTGGGAERHLNATPCGRLL